MEDETSAEHWVLRYPTPLPSGEPVNDVATVHVYLPRNRSGPVPAVVVLHYWGATDHRVERNTALELVRRGMAGLVVALPYHLERTPAGTRSGDLAITPDPPRLVRTMTQSILDLRRLVDWVESRPEFRAGRVGLTGASLGAIVGALAAAVDPRFTDAAFVVGGIDVANILWHSSRVVKEREELRGAGYTENRLRAELAEIEPRNFFPAPHLRNSYVVAARHDTVIPARNAELLIEALGSPSQTWLDTGHYGGFFIQKQVQRSVAEFFQKSFADQPFQAPRRIDAPTIRLGVTYDGDDGMQIGAGLDLIRSNGPRDLFANLFASPESVQLVIGAKLDRGFAAGLFVRPDDFSFGIIWSMIL